MTAVGCGQSARNLSLDESKAKNACTVFLNAWKDRKKSVDLKPAITGKDEDWEAGRKLASIELLPDERSDGVNPRVPVRIVLKDDAGAESQQQATYIVGTSPVVTVFRSDVVD
jgi:hypothetical protein